MEQNFGFSCLQLKPKFTILVQGEFQLKKYLLQGHGKQTELDEVYSRGVGNNKTCQQMLR